MQIIRRKRWEIPQREVTPEHLFLNRRGLLKGAAALGMGSIASTQAQASLYPARRNDKFTGDVTPESVSSRYNNFYEFGLAKNVYLQTGALKPRPWRLTIDGLVEKPFEIDAHELISKMPLEERVYRLRCVEAWSMVIPWTGFPLKALLDFAKPSSAAKFVRFETFLDPKMASGQRSFFPWPYVEGLTIEEAANDLSLMVTGVYGKELPNVHGAPLRLMVPWKYGFKSIKSITKISFLDKRPETFWEASGPTEYGFWANVNPQVSHPRWSQAAEEVIGTGERRPTQLFNGYGEFVADLYKNMQGEKLYM
jgi:sulfoxide reductase catalytic subunit YedY